MNSYFLFFIGLSLLLIGGDFLVKSSTKISKKFNIPSFIIGLTVVSFATSAPELFISLEAINNQNYDIIFGNVIGSNIANICLVLAITLIFVNVRFSDLTKKIDIPFLLFSTLLFSAFLFIFKSISFWIGIVFFFFISLYLFIVTKKSYVGKDNEKQSKFKSNIVPQFLILLISAVMLKFGAEWLISGVTRIAVDFGVSDRVIAFTLVAVGTSLPELSTSFVAIYKKEKNLAVGNLIGSNIFNLLIVLGITSMFGNIKIVDTRVLTNDVLFLIASTFILCVIVYSTYLNKNNKLSGIMLLCFYILFLITATV
tara:strand:- start:597 stop:1532 length:936 start_codon:yes stop_codon:yes gene_type:complete